MSTALDTHLSLRAHALGVLPDDDVAAAAADALELGWEAYTAAYEEYSVGSWALAPLWSDPSGDASGESHEHGDPAKPIPTAAHLSGINALVSEYFNTSRLRGVRLFRASHGALIIPHSDYLEHRNGFTRMHVPLVTDPAQARNTEDNICYHMRRGEVWFLDGHRVHSGGVVGPSLRLHLVFDFSHDTAPDETLAREIPAAERPLLIDRSPLPPDLIPSYLALAPFIDAAAWRDLVHILARVHLRYDVPTKTVYDWLETIARASTGPDRDILVRDAERMKRYYISDGPGSTTTYDALWSDALAESSS
jgi:L-proline 3-hydroxylase, C-terminal/Aspartyl/Asparaginyl beta-hydroxylase